MAKVPVHLIPGLSALLRYPDEGSRAMAVALADAAMATGHPCQEYLEAFALTARDLDLRGLQELYTRSFDLNPECTLDVGWHLFGETYRRGQFLAMMRHHLAAHGIDEGGNLPDHLPGLLDLGQKLETADAMDLVDDCLLPALEKLLPALRPKQDAKAHGAEHRPEGGGAGGTAMKESAYRHLLQALFLIFTVDRMPSGGDRPAPPHARPGPSPDQSSPAEAACAD